MSTLFIVGITLQTIVTLLALQGATVLKKAGIEGAGATAFMAFVLNIFVLALLIVALVSL